MKLNFPTNVLLLIVLAYFDFCFKSCVCRRQSSPAHDMYSYGRPEKYRSDSYDLESDYEPRLYRMSDRSNDYEPEYESHGLHRRERAAYSKSNGKPKKRQIAAEPRRMMKISDLSDLPKTHGTGRKSNKETEEKMVVINHRHVKSRTAKDGLGKLLNQPGCGKSKNFEVTRIVGGADAPEGKHPWIAAILKDGSPHCGGTIINKNWILTAAHCFMGENPASSTWAIRIGTINRNEGPTYKIKKVITHERFNLDTMLNSDIALMQVSKPIEFTKLIVPVCLPNNSLDEPKTDKFLVAGWGALNFDDEDMPVMLQDITLNVVKDTDCAKKYREKHYVLYKSQICTWNYKKDACQGDSGGPAVEIVDETATLVGVVSYGSTCADDFPGVYTQVSYFLKWIKQTIDENTN